jgi:hypothetical protein
LAGSAPLHILANYNLPLNRALVAKEFMRTLQMLGFLSAVVGMFLTYILLSPIEPDTSASAASASGLGLMFGVFPILCFSALTLIPSSLGLLNSKIRVKSYFTGKFWHCLWGINSIISVLYLIVIIYFCYLFLVQSISN